MRHRHRSGGRAGAGRVPAAPAVLAAPLLPPPLRLPFAFPRLRKYGRRHREPVPVAAPTSDDDDVEEDGDYDEDEEGMEMEVEEEEFLATRPKPAGFGEGKTYSTDIEEQLLREMGLGGARRGGDAASAKRREGNSPGKETGTGWFPALLVLPANCSLLEAQRHTWTMHVANPLDQGMYAPNLSYTCVHCCEQ